MHKYIIICVHFYARVYYIMYVLLYLEKNLKYTNRIITIMLNVICQIIIIFTSRFII